MKTKVKYQVKKFYLQKQEVSQEREEFPIACVCGRQAALVFLLTGSLLQERKAHGFGQTTTLVNSPSLLLIWLRRSSFCQNTTLSPPIQSHLDEKTQTTS